MFKTNQTDSSITLNFSSELANVDIAVSNLEKFFHLKEIRKAEKLNIVIRELLINAIEHGNRKKPEKLVTCFIEDVGEKIFKIAVKDEGEGFDHRNISVEMPEDPGQIRNRGLSIVNRFCDKLEFNSEGNETTAIYRDVNETDFDVTEKEGCLYIHPNGDITATVADKFRLLLKEYVDSGYLKYSFDMGDVVDIDSVTLSSFIILHKLVAKKQATPEIAMTNVNSDLLNLFKMTYLDRLFFITEKQN